MKQILFLTSYNAQSKIIYRYAQKLAQYFDAGITLAHIYEEPNLSLVNSPASFYVNGIDLKKLNDDLWDKQMDRIKEFAAEMDAKQFSAIPLDYIVTDGDVVEELIAIEQQNHFDLVVMGMRRHNLSGRLFGNTTYQLIDRMKCPLFLVPPENNFMGIDNIVYGTAFELGDTHTIDHLLDWCLAFDASLHVLHVFKNKERADEVQANMALLKRKYRAENELDVINFQMMEGKIIEAIDKYVDTTQADLLAIHRRNQGFWDEIRSKSLTKQMIEKAKVPILVLK